MLLDITTRLIYDCPTQTDLLVQVEVPDLPDQRVLASDHDLPEDTRITRVAAEAGIGERLWITAQGRFHSTYTARVEVDRACVELSTLDAVSLHDLSSAELRYLMPSRYCQPDLLTAFVEAEFAGLKGGALMAAMAAWVTDNLTYTSGASDGQTTAFDTFLSRQGVCRDYAHVLIAMARAAAIPARFASVHAPGVTPPDFHAVVEVYLAGTWHLMDPTGMARADQIVRIGVGLDAAEVAFLTSYGAITFVEQSVDVRLAGA